MPRDFTALVDWRRKADSACCLAISIICFGDNGSGCAAAVAFESSASLLLMLLLRA